METFKSHTLLWELIFWKQLGIINNYTCPLILPYYYCEIFALSLSV